MTLYFENDFTLETIKTYSLPLKRGLFRKLLEQEIFYSTATYKRLFHWIHCDFFEALSVSENFTETSKAIPLDCFRSLLLKEVSPEHFIKIAFLSPGLLRDLLCDFSNLRALLEKHHLLEWGLLHLNEVLRLYTICGDRYYDLLMQDLLPFSLFTDPKNPILNKPTREKELGVDYGSLRFNSQGYFEHYCPIVNKWVLVSEG